MKKIVLAATLAAFSIAAVAPAFAKDAPGKCGTGKYFDKKTKKCTAK